jgi:hypothetical protein
VCGLFGSSLIRFGKAANNGNRRFGAVGVLGRNDNGTAFKSNNQCAAGARRHLFAFCSVAVSASPATCPLKTMGMVAGCFNVICRGQSARFVARDMKSNASGNTAPCASALVLQRTNCCAHHRNKCRNWLRGRVDRMNFMTVDC